MYSLAFVKKPFGTDECSTLFILIRWQFNDAALEAHQAALSQLTTDRSEIVSGSHVLRCSVTQ
jgi:hypothetical protein